MNELSLFTGAGGGVLGTTLLGWKHVGYVEYDNYCQKILKQRIADGILDAAPIFGDIRKFISEGFAEAYKGMVDIVSAGFPCQPFSVAGKRKGVDDERNMWPATADVIRIVRPRYVLLENVPGIREYLPVVIRDLRRLGYSVRRPLILGADDVGAPHRRKRIWIMGYSECGGCGGESWRRSGTEFEDGYPRVEEKDVADASYLHSDGSDNNTGVCLEGKQIFKFGNSGWAKNVAYSEGWEPRNPPEWERREDFSGRGEEVANSGSKGLSEPTHGRIGSLSETPGASEGRKPGGRVAKGRRDWPVEPDVGRVAHGVASRVDRLKAIGNGQVPRVVAAAWKLLVSSLKFVV